MDYAEHDSYNPKDYTSTETPLLFRGVHYVKHEKFFAGKLIGTSFECNCSFFTTDLEVQKFINNVFFNVPDPFIAI